MNTEISLSVGDSSLHTPDPLLALQVLQRLCPSLAAEQFVTATLETIPASTVPRISDQLDGGTVFAIHWIDGVEYALVDMGAEAEIKGAYGKRGVEVITTHGDGLANTHAMAEAGSELAKKAITLGAYIPSAAESHLLMCAKQAGVIKDLNEESAYWTSTQSSADYAYIMAFANGWQDHGAKDRERLAPLVRRHAILR